MKEVFAKIAARFYLKRRKDFHVGNAGKFVFPDDFSYFTYSKKSHFDLFDEYDYDVTLFKEKFDPARHPLKRFTDLLVFSFIQQIIPKRSRLLDVGGGKSRIIEYFKKDYECWNIDKLQGVGLGPRGLKPKGFRLVKDYMGNFNPELPDDYFDFVFSISALEHVPEDTELFDRILKDLNRVLKPGGYSLHCFDAVIKEKTHWTNGLLRYLFANLNTLNEFVPFDVIRKDADLFVLSEEIYKRSWQQHTGKTYHEFGKPFSYNVLWKK